MCIFLFYFFVVKKWFPRLSMRLLQVQSPNPLQICPWSTYAMIVGLHPGLFFTEGTLLFPPGIGFTPTLQMHYRHVTLIMGLCFQFWFLHPILIYPSCEKTRHPTRMFHHSSCSSIPIDFNFYKTSPTNYIGYVYRNIVPVLDSRNGRHWDSLGVWMLDERHFMDERNNIRFINDIQSLSSGKNVSFS
jgi:hypothetical protein